MRKKNVRPPVRGNVSRAEKKTLTTGSNKEVIAEAKEVIAIITKEALWNG
jgi:hypothetical protein